LEDVLHGGDLESDEVAEKWYSDINENRSRRKLPEVIRKSKNKQPSSLFLDQKRETDLLYVFLGAEQLSAI